MGVSSLLLPSMWDPGTELKVIKLGGKCFYSLSHFAGHYILYTACTHMLYSCFADTMILSMHFLPNHNTISIPKGIKQLLSPSNS